MLPLVVTFLATAKVVGVTTTILEVNDAVRDMVLGTALAKLVVIGDRKTNDTEWRAFGGEHKNVMYFSYSDQQKLPYAIVRILPANHFGRKSIGFLLALDNGATHIYDFDDDNHLQLQVFDSLSFLPVYNVATSHHLYNPYPFFRPESGGAPTFVWPNPNPNEKQATRQDSTSRIPL